MISAREKVALFGIQLLLGSFLKMRGLGLDKELINR